MEKIGSRHKDLQTLEIDFSSLNTCNFSELQW